MNQSTKYLPTYNEMKIFTEQVLWDDTGYEELHRKCSRKDSNFLIESCLNNHFYRSVLILPYTSMYWLKSLSSKLSVTNYFPQPSSYSIRQLLKNEKISFSARSKFKEQSEISKILGLSPVSFWVLGSVNEKSKAVVISESSSYLSRRIKWHEYLCSACWIFYLYSLNSVFSILREAVSVVGYFWLQFLF